MKKCLLMKEDDINIILGVSKVDIDPVETDKAVKEFLKNNPKTKKSRKELYAELAVPCKYGNEYKIVTDSEGDEVQKKLNKLTEHERLNKEIEIIPYWKGTEYWTHKEKWEKKTVGKSGEELPSDAIFDNNLTQEQRKEIFDQQEEERFEALTPEQKIKEKKAKIEAQLDALDREYLTPRILAGITQGDTYSIGKAQEHEQFSVPLRAKWKKLDRGELIE